MNGLIQNIIIFNLLLFSYLFIYFYVLCRFLNTVLSIMALKICKPEVLNLCLSSSGMKASITTVIQILTLSVHCLWSHISFLFGSTLSFSHFSFLSSIDVWWCVCLVHPITVLYWCQALAQCPPSCLEGKAHEFISVLLSTDKKVGGE